MNQVLKLMLLGMMLIKGAELKSQTHQAYEAAEQLYKDKKYEECKSALAVILAEQGTHHDSTLAATYKLNGDLFLKKYSLKETVEQYEKADSIYEKLGKRHAEKRLNVVNKIGICYAQQDNLIMTAKYFQQAYDIAVATFEADDLNVGKATNNLSTVYLYLGDFDESLKYFYKSAEIKEKFVDENPMPLGKTYENISTIYGQINQMGEAERYLQKAGQLYQKDSVASKQTLLGYYLNLAGFYLESERVDEALSQLEKGDALSEDYKADKLEVLILHRLFGEAHLQKENFAKAIEYFNETKSLVKKFDVGLNEMGAVYTHMAGIYAKQGDNAKTLESLASARDAILQNYKKPHKNYLGILQKQIFILLKIDELDQAEEMIVEYKTHFEARNESLAKDLLFSNLKMGLHSAKLNFALASYRQNTSEALLDKGIASADEVIAFQDKVLETIGDKDSKLYFFSTAYSNFSTAIYFLLQKHKRTAEQSYLEKAFLLAEKTKYYSLRERRGLRFPKLENSVPKDLVENEKQAKIMLSQVISRYENKLETESDPDQMLGLINQIDSLKTVHKTAIQKLAEASPLLANYINSEQTFALHEAQQYFQDKDRVYVSYFLSGNDLLSENYAFVLQEGGLRCVNLPTVKDSLDQSIVALLESLKLDLNTPKLESQMRDYEKPSSKLYASLIASLDLEGDNGIVFNLHERLHSIPFEALLNKEANKFLIQEQPVAYTYSLTSLLDADRMEYDEALLCCSPQFEKKGTLGLLPLLNSDKEVKNISTLLGEENALAIRTKTEFQEQIAQHKFNVIHLATHASANQRKGYQSYLAFGNETSDLLYSREIYGLPIKANLVVLSACESGDGQLIESQGVLGLATAFASTATQSMVASLWKVNDASSEKVMTDYYKNLKDGSAKDKALQHSKLNYLSSVPKSLQHPYYWAGFIQVGSIDALAFDNGIFAFLKSNLGWFLLAFAILLIFLFGLKNKAASRV